MNRIITQSYLDRFQDHLRREEKSPVTVEKYLRDVRAFLAFAGERVVTKELVIAYKQDLVRRGYAVRSINSMLASLNSLLRFLGWEDCKTRSIRQQRQTYCAQERQLTREEYLRLLEAARSRPRLYYLLQTICATGVRVSEIQYFTLEAVKRGQVIIRCKNKTRTILIPEVDAAAREADFAVLLSDASMEPLYSSGAVLLCAQRTPTDQEYGVYLLNQELLLRRLCRRRGLTRLLAPSLAFPDLQVGPEDKLECLGAITGQARGCRWESLPG